MADMTTCTFCNNEMTTGASCTVETLHLGGMPFDVAPHRGRDECGDCGVAPGGFHHIGCDMQGCPRCGGQLLMCGCPWDGLRDEGDDFDDLDDLDLPVEVGPGG